MRTKAWSKYYFGAERKQSSKEGIWGTQINFIINPELRNVLEDKRKIKQCCCLFGFGWLFFFFPEVSPL